MGELGKAYQRLNSSGYDSTLTHINNTQLGRDLAAKRDKLRIENFIDGLDFENLNKLNPQFKFKDEFVDGSTLKNSQAIRALFTFATRNYLSLPKEINEEIAKIVMRNLLQVEAKEDSLTRAKELIPKFKSVFSLLKKTQSYESFVNQANSETLKLLSEDKDAFTEALVKNYLSRFAKANEYESNEAAEELTGVINKLNGFDFNQSQGISQFKEIDDSDEFTLAPPEDISDTVLKLRKEAADEERAFQLEASELGEQEQAKANKERLKQERNDKKS